MRVNKVAASRLWRVKSATWRSAARAAKEIKALIEDSVNRVDMGSVLVESAGDTMGDIVNAVTRVTDIMGEIASASMNRAAVSTSRPR